MFNPDINSNSIQHSPKLPNCPTFLLKTKLNKQSLQKTSKFQVQKDNSSQTQKYLLKSWEISYANGPQEFTPRSTPRKRSEFMQKFTDSWNFREIQNVKSPNETLDSQENFNFCSSTGFRSESANEPFNKKQINKNFVSSCDLTEKKDRYFKSIQFERIKRSPLSIKLSNSQEKLEKRESVNSLESQPIMKKDTKIQDFQLLNQLGKGHCSVVYLAKHKELSMLFAIKVLSKESIKSSNLEQHIFREIKIHSFLKDKNIVTLYKTFDDEKHIYLVMEYTPEGSLYSELKKSQKFNEQKTSKVLKDISRGLKSIHSNHVIHRDLKLENILLCNDVAKVADFGCAVNSIFMRKSLIGSPVYFSPEQLNRNFYGSKTDIWQLGVMAFQMLFGFAPFEKQIISAIQNDEQNVDLKLRLPEKSLSEDARDFLMKCLDKRQNWRMDIDQVLAHPFLNWEV